MMIKKCKCNTFNNSNARFHAYLLLLFLLLLSIKNGIGYFCTGLGTLLWFSMSHADLGISIDSFYPLVCPQLCFLFLVIHSTCCIYIDIS